MCTNGLSNLSEMKNLINISLSSHVYAFRNWTYSKYGNNKQPFNQYEQTQFAKDELTLHKVNGLKMFLKIIDCARVLIRLCSKVF